MDASDDGDEVIVSPGTYHENLKIDSLVTLRSSNGAETTIIHGDGTFTTIDIKDQNAVSGDRVKIEGFTITGGRGTSGRGGGITVTTSDPIISNNIITGNTGGPHGGGLLINDEAHPRIEDNEISANATPQFGGGLYIANRSQPEIIGNTITGNTATSVISVLAGGGGAGLYVDVNSAPIIRDNRIEGNIAKHAGGAIALRVGSGGEISDNIITGNQAAYGAGVHFETEGSSLTLRNNIITDNTAVADASFPGSGFGGGVSVYNASRPLIAENTIYDNVAASGGAGIVVAEFAEPTIARNEIYGNDVSQTGNDKHGGGIYIAGSAGHIRNNIIYDNTASLGGGISLINGSETFVENNTITGNAAAFVLSGNHFGGGIHIESTILSAAINNNIIESNTGYQVYEARANSANFKSNLINDDDRGLYSSNASVRPGTASAFDSSASTQASGTISGDPEYSEEVNNNYAPQPTSITIDAGTTVQICNDFDGNERPYGAGYDIGAFEYTTLAKSTLTPLFRFYSSVFQGHFYTASTVERDLILNDDNWIYEGEVYSIAESPEQDMSPIHRFWSEVYKHHFYTISDTERQSLIDNDPNWSYEGVVYYTFPQEESETRPVYRFYSPVFRGHFYTTSEGERQSLIDNDTNWTYEGIAWYASSKVTCSD